MKRLIAIVLSIAMILTGCAAPSTINSTEQTEYASKTEMVEVREPETVGKTQNTEPKPEGAAQSVSFSGLDDPVLLTYFENTVYEDLIAELNSDEYFVEKVEAVYLSKEYVEELAYNSQSNVFFGYTIEELEDEFQGKRYVFTLGDDGQTTVVELEEVYDDTYDQVIKNAAIGSGVILVCVTVSVATAGVSPAVSVIFAASAATGTTFALESGTISFAAASLARGYQTHDFNEALKAGTLAASEGFRWGAIIGAVHGGVEETLALMGATLNGLTMNEAAAIQRESKWPLDAIKSFHSTEEYKIYKDANLVPTQLSDGMWAFLRKINWNTIDSYGRTNAQRVARGLAPIDLTGKPYELHHMIKPLHYYDTEFGLICSQEELPVNIENHPEKSMQLNEFYSNNYFSITLYNSGRGIAENIKITINFENGIWYEEILSSITKNIDKYRGINTKELEFKLLFMDSKEKFDAYFSETINKMVRNFCIIDIDNYFSQNYEGINFLGNKQFNIAKLKLSYEDALTGHIVTNEYIINIYIQKNLMLKKYDSKYIIKVNLEEYRHHVKKKNSSIINNLFE